MKLLCKAAVSGKNWDAHEVLKCHCTKQSGLQFGYSASLTKFQNLQNELAQLLRLEFWGRGMRRSKCLKQTKTNAISRKETLQDEPSHPSPNLRDLRFWLYGPSRKNVKSWSPVAKPKKCFKNEKLFSKKSSKRSCFPLQVSSRWSAKWQGPQLARGRGKKVWVTIFSIISFSLSGYGLKHVKTLVP